MSRVESSLGGSKEGSRQPYAEWGWIWTTKEKERQKGRESISRLRTQPASLIHPPRYFFFLPRSPSTTNDFSLLCLAFKFAPTKLLSFSPRQVHHVRYFLTKKKKREKKKDHSIWNVRKDLSLIEKFHFLSVPFILCLLRNCWPKLEVHGVNSCNKNENEYFVLRLG